MLYEVITHGGQIGGRAARHRREEFRGALPFAGNPRQFQRRAPEEGIGAAGGGHGFKRREPGLDLARAGQAARLPRRLPVERGGAQPRDAFLPFGREEGGAGVRRELV